MKISRWIYFDHIGVQIGDIDGIFFAFRFKRSELLLILDRPVLKWVS